MIRQVSIVVLTALLFNCAGIPRHYLEYRSTGPIVISAHVGETVDPEERERYELFQQVSGFKTAAFYGIDNGGFEVHIITENDKLIAVNRDPSAIEILRDYIDRYDEIRESPIQFEKQWEIVGYDELGLAITQHEVKRVRKNVGCIGCVGGAAILITVPSVLFIALAHDMPWRDDITIAATLGLIAGVALGRVIGRQIDQGAALKAIKKARKPKIVE